MGNKKLIRKYYSTPQVTKQLQHDVKTRVVSTEHHTDASEGQIIRHKGIKNGFGEDSTPGPGLKLSE